MQRVNKTAARKAYDAGRAVVFIPCNLNSINCEPLLKEEVWDSFDELTKEVMFRNCNGHNGRYLHYYLG